MLRKQFITFCLLLTVSLTAWAQSAPKREFRGAWIQCVNGQFQNLGTEKMQQTLTGQLDELQRMGVNAIIFQVRPECDALYASALEPRSRFLTGEQGRAPQPYWDPLQWMVEQCHQRGMELHAWINPYRAKTKVTPTLAANHIARRYPDRVFAYDGLLILNPGIAENRDYICTVAEDIVSRYDVDGLHIDDYFYPYPVAGQQIPDDAQYQLFSNGIRDRSDWRRYNVNLFIRQLSETIHRVKPWVKFGVSPFGIYRNKKNDPNGSQTNGLQNYDDLYADVLLWVNNGWIDYCVPQLYWQIGHPTADYEELIRWWNKNAGARPLYIGEDIERTVKHPNAARPSEHQQAPKMALHSQLPNVDGTVLWYAKMAVDNPGNYATNLRNVYWRYPALQPAMPFIDGKAPKKPRRLKCIDIEGQQVLFWTAPSGRGWKDAAVKYVVYRFADGETVSTNDASKIVAVTTDTYYELPAGAARGTYVVTALDRLQNESKPVKVRLR